MDGDCFINCWNDHKPGLVRFFKLFVFYRIMWKEGLMNHKKRKWRKLAVQLEEGAERLKVHS
ncbi:hypothetical protein CICLE_v10013301mg [Citrus x clementina]|uniref:Uncharacterized protein n=1 Tax=Citrus clementina TaxID=85681 RepID=V4US08_CITCL|nr:hypothetical protein CICLE_v10013301mg [Citrus x clementina]